MSVESTTKSNALSHLTLENLNLLEELQIKEQFFQTIQSKFDLSHNLLIILCELNWQISFWISLQQMVSRVGRGRSENLHQMWKEFLLRYFATWLHWKNTINYNPILLFFNLSRNNDNEESFSEKLFTLKTWLLSFSSL